MPPLPPLPAELLCCTIMTVCSCLHDRKAGSLCTHALKLARHVHTSCFPQGVECANVQRKRRMLEKEGVAFDGHKARMLHRLHCYVQSACALPACLPALWCGAVNSCPQNPQLAQHALRACAAQVARRACVHSQELQQLVQQRRLDGTRWTP